MYSFWAAYVAIPLLPAFQLRFASSAVSIYDYEYIIKVVRKVKQTNQKKTTQPLQKQNLVSERN